MAVSCRFGTSSLDNGYKGLGKRAPPSVSRSLICDKIQLMNTNAVFSSV